MSKIVVNCPVCQVTKTLVYHTRKPIYCSNACKQRAKRARPNKKENHYSHIIDNRAIKCLSSEQLGQVCEQLKAIAFDVNTVSVVDYTTQSILFDVYSYVYDLYEMTA